MHREPFLQGFTDSSVVELASFVHAGPAVTSSKLHNRMRLTADLFIRASLIKEY